MHGGSTKEWTVFVQNKIRNDVPRVVEPTTHTAAQKMSKICCLRPVHLLSEIKVFLREKPSCSCLQIAVNSCSQHKRYRFMVRSLKNNMRSLCCGVLLLKLSEEKTCISFREKDDKMMLQYVCWSACTRCRTDRKVFDAVVLLSVAAFVAVSRKNAVRDAAQKRKPWSRYLVMNSRLLLQFCRILLIQQVMSRSTWWCHNDVQMQRKAWRRV